MSDDAFKILGEELAKREAELNADMNALLFPDGRQAAYDRLSAMCELSPTALGFGPISREPSPWWKTRY